MKIVIAHDGGSAVVRLVGRLDGEWAEHLSETLDDFLQEGLRSVVLDMSEVTYISSAGTQVLAQRYHDFSVLRAELRVTNPSPVVRSALQMIEMEDRLLYEEPAEIPIAARTRSSALMHRLADHTHESWRAPLVTTAKGHYEFTPRESGGALAARLYGDPRLLRQRPFGAADCSPVAFPDSVFGLGLGALGTTPEECLPRLGELVAVGGIAAYLPTDGALVADYQVGTRSRPPQTMLAYGITCEGRFSHLGRFRPLPDSEAVPLAELASVVLSTTGSDIAGMVVVAETAGLVGADLRRTAGAPSGSSLTFGSPGVTEWLSFTPEPAYQGTTAIIVGVVARRPSRRLAEFLRPVANRPDTFGHFHAVVFPYRPVPQRTVAMQGVVMRLFGGIKIRAVLHLLDDDRGAAGAGCSGFLRGLCWAAPVTQVLEPGS